MEKLKLLPHVVHCGRYDVILSTALDGYSNVYALGSDKITSCCSYLPVVVRHTVAIFVATEWEQPKDVNGVARS